MEYKERYKIWCEKVTDPELKADLEAMAGHDEAVQDAFFKELEFGTAGLRGVLGAGTNRMNIYTVAKASQGLAVYLKKNFDEPSIAVSYDSRIKSDLFAKVASCVFAANGVKVYLWPQLMPVPALSYSVRALSASAGVVVTASHNPSKYNGYKVYGPDGCQLTTEASEAVFTEIEKLDIFDDVKMGDFDSAVEKGIIEYISEDVYSGFVDNVKKLSVLYGEEINKGIEIVYSPLNGSGLGPVTRTLRESGYTNITIVKEQEQPDGNFPTCPYPNPEIREAMELGIKYAQEHNADLLLATDPDCDRVGIAVKNHQGEYVLLTGNQTGVLLLDYICSQKTKHGKMPENPLFIKTIVTTDLAEKVAAGYGVRTKNVLTGFKFIGEQIGRLEEAGCGDSYVFGYEESYGYLSGTHVRDKDAVNGAFLICEMFSYYASKGIGLLDRLEAIYGEYGYCLNKVHSYMFEGAAGFAKMKEIMAGLRQVKSSIGNFDIDNVTDYSVGVDGLPKSDVLVYHMCNGDSVIVRPSGTEPKIKVYMSINAPSKEMAESREDEVRKAVEAYLA